MRKYTAEIVVGVVVFLAIVITVASYIYFKQLPLRSGRYSLNVLFNNATNLEINDPVTIAGVRVGRVRSIDLYEDKALVHLEIEKSLELPTNTQATIQSIGLVGDKEVELAPGNATTYLANNDTLRGKLPPSIESLLPNVDKLIVEATQTLVHLRSLVDSTLNQQTRADLHESLAHTAQISKALDQNMDQMLARWNTILVNIDTISTGISMITSQKRRQVENTIDNLTESSRRANDLLARLDSSAAVVNGILTHIQSGRSSLSNVLYSDAFYTRVDSITTEVENLLQDFKKRPQKYLNINFIRVF